MSFRASGSAGPSRTPHVSAGWLANDSSLPKLWIRAVPGAILSTASQDADPVDYVRGFANQEEVTVFGSHYVQEVSPHAIGRALARLISRLA